MSWAAAWAVIGPIVKLCIPVPVLALAAAGAWLWIDRTSAVRQAVDRATTELVAGGQIAALKAELAAARRDKQAADYAYAGFTRKLAADQARADADKTEQEIADYAGKLAAGGCGLDQSDIDWLRK